MYDITKHTSPKMPSLGNGTECIKILLSQASKDMHDPLVPMLFPILHNPTPPPKNGRIFAFEFKRAYLHGDSVVTPSQVREKVLQMARRRRRRSSNSRSGYGAAM